MERQHRHKRSVPRLSVVFEFSALYGADFFDSGTAGFSASPGWDPVTGLGTPNYPRMLQHFLSH